jgi:hypothetical protein
MGLAQSNYDALREKIEVAVSKELPQVEELRKEARRLSVIRLRERPCRSIAPVATDGGENRLSFEPLNLEIIRVVDSEGQELVQEIIALSEDDSVFAELSAQSAVMQNMLRKMGKDFEDLSYLLGHKGRKNTERTPDNRGRVRAFRDILEWAVLLELASKEWPVDVLLLRDGLLRTKTIKRQTFPSLDQCFRDAFNEQERKGSKRVYLVGVAKTSAVLSKLSLALLLEQTFRREYSCYAEVPHDLEARCYNYDRTWLDTGAEEIDSDRGQLYQSFGRLHLVKLSNLPDGPIFPVDIPYWLPQTKRQEILEYLVHDASDNFPIVGYPSALQRAHEHAVMTGLEMTVLGDLMTQAIASGMDKDLIEELIRHVCLGRGLIAGGARKGG